MFMLDVTFNSNNQWIQCIDFLRDIIYEAHNSLCTVQITRLVQQLPCQNTWSYVSPNTKLLPFSIEQMCIVAFLDPCLLQCLYYI